MNRALFLLIALFTICISDLTIIPERHEITHEKQKPHQMNPALVDALRKINDDPSLIKSMATPLNDHVGLSEERMKEIEEVMEWISANRLPDDTESIKIILKRLREDDGDDAEVESDLELLRDFLYQIDNGVDFGKLDGFQTMIQYAKHTNEKIRLQAWWTIGAACSNNPDAIELALESGVMPPLANALSVEEHNGVLPKLIYALSSVIRQHRVAQHKFEKHQGQLLLKTLYWTSEPRLKRKVEGLVVDVVAMNEWNSLFQTSSWCELFRDGVLDTEAGYTQVTNSLRFFANVLVDCPQATETRKFRRRLKKIRKTLQAEEPDSDVDRWVDLILNHKKEKEASQAELKALPASERDQDKLEL